MGYTYRLSFEPQDDIKNYVDLAGYDHAIIISISLASFELGPNLHHCLPPGNDPYVDY